MNETSSSTSSASDLASVPSTPVPITIVRRKLTLLPLVAVMYFTVSGGAYGLEDLVGSSGPGMSLLLIIVTPLIWSLPTALMVAELSSAMPVKGGYYSWVKKGLGPFWGFQEGWWSWLTSFVDLAIYPVLFADYLSTLLIQQFNFQLLKQSELAHWGVTLAVIWTFSLLNIRGSKSVGDSSNLFGIFILAPFLVMSVLGIGKLLMNPVPIWEPIVPPDKTLLGAFGVGLFVVMWNYLGWDNTSTVADEVDEPAKNYPRALMFTIPLVTLAYLLPTVAGLGSTSDWSGWTAGYFPEVAAQIGGKWLGGWLAIGGLVSAVGLFSACLMNISRLPAAMAEDGYFPQILTRRHPKYDSPYVSIILCACIYSFFTLSAFSSLVVIDVILYSCALLLEFATLIAMRIKEPTMKRPVRVPGGWLGVILVTLFPVSVLTLAVVSTIQEEGVKVIYMALAAIVTGPLAYPILKRFVKKDHPSVEIEIEREESP